jgi:FkbM family methyltransferase
MLLKSLIRGFFGQLWQSAAWLLATRIPLINRIVQPAPGKPGWVRIGIRGSHFLMPDHPFWRASFSGWEPDTERIYRALVRPGDVVVDVGAWIGPTVMFACACQAGRILAIEPNPACQSSLDALAATIATKRSELLLCNCGIYTGAGEMEFGSPTGKVIATSAASLRGTGTRIQVDTLPHVLAKYGIAAPTFVKIDIEGVEFDIADQIQSFADMPGTHVFLSLHPPFVPDGNKRNGLLTALEKFDIYDSSLRPMTHDTVATRVHSEVPRPGWGTEYGNYFEILLVPRGESLTRTGP